MTHSPAARTRLWNGTPGWQVLPVPKPDLRPGRSESQTHHRRALDTAPAVSRRSKPADGTTAGKVQVRKSGVLGCRAFLRVSAHGQGPRSTHADSATVQF